MARTQAQRKAETRGRLLGAAAALFARDGFHGTSTDAVADAADRTSGAIYAHFGDKHGLLLALLDEMKDATSRVMLADLEHAASPAERVAVLWRDFAAPPEPLGDRWLLLEHELWLWAARNPQDADRLAHRYARERAALAAGLATFTDEDQPRPPADTAVLVLALLLGLEMQRRLDPGAVPDRLAVDGLLRLFATGPRAASAASTPTPATATSPASPTDAPSATRSRPPTPPTPATHAPDTPTPPDPIDRRPVHAAQ